MRLQEGSSVSRSCFIPSCFNPRLTPTRRYHTRLAIRPARSHRVKVAMRLAPLPNDNCDSPLPVILGSTLKRPTRDEEVRNKAERTYGEVESVIYRNSFETTLALVIREFHLISTETNLARCLSNERIYRILNGLAVLDCSAKEIIGSLR